MKKKFITDIRIIKKAINSNKLVVFAGAGVSIDAGVPLWKTLIDEFKDGVDIPDDEFDYLKIAQMYFNERQQKEFIEKVRLVLKHKKLSYNEIHDEIFDLNPQHIVTTNYDNLFEQVINKRSLPFSVISKDSEFPYTSNIKHLVKMHGDLNNKDFVLKEDDYIDYSKNHPLIESFIKSLFASKTILFIGYSFSDIDLKMIIQNVRNILGGDFQNAYLLSTNINLHKTQQDYLKKKGIEVVSYFDADLTGNKNFIEDYLHGNNSQKKNYFEKGLNLSDEGQRMYNFIRFLSKYSPFDEKLIGKKSIEQIFLSLNRFSELKSLPPSFVANLYPFKATSEYANNHNGLTLLINNHELHDFFFDQIDVNDKGIEFSDPPEWGLSDRENKKYKKMVNYIFDSLNNSLILYVDKKGKKLDSLGYHGGLNEPKKIHFIVNKNHQGLEYIFERFEFDRVIELINTSTIEKITDTTIGLKHAYYNYKVGSFYNSYLLFRDVAGDAWQKGEYFSYIIAKKNMKILRNLIKTHEWDLDKNKKDKILDEILKIDIYKLITEIPNRGESEQKLFEIIRDDWVLKDVEVEIEALFKKVLYAYDFYNNKIGTHSTANYYTQINIELYKILTFYSNNFIIMDEYTDFTKVCNKALQSLLISYATSKDYESRLREFNKLFFDVFVNYGNAEDAKEIISKYKIKELVFCEDQYSKIIDVVNNYFKSFFETNKFSRDRTFVNKNTKSQILKSDHFSDNCRTRFVNMMFLLSNTKVNKIKTIKIIPNLLSFIEHESFLTWSNLKYLSVFIKKNHNLFSEKDLLRLFEIVTTKNLFYNDIIGAISYAFEKNKYKPISDNEIIEKLIIHSKDDRDRDRTIIELWAISNNSIKEKFKTELVEKLESIFDFNLYQDLCFNEIMGYDLFFEKYVLDINKRKGDGSYKLNSSGFPILNTFIFTNAMILIYKMNIKPDDKRLNKFTDLADWMEFYLFPEKFDYSKFKAEWVLLGYFSGVFFKRFSKILEIKEAIEKSLKDNYNERLAKIYTKYFI